MWAVNRDSKDVGPHYVGMTPFEIEEKAGLVLVADRVRRDLDDRSLRRDRDSADLVRIRRGAYARAERWGSLTSADRYRARIMAVVGTRRRVPVVGYDSAAALWDYPRFGRWPAQVHLIVNAASAARSKNGVLVHRETLDSEDVVDLDGILVTNHERTLVDLSRTAAFRDSVSALDRALNLARRSRGISVTKEALRSVLDRTGSARGRRMAAKAIAFADGRADNAGESASRVAIFELGFPAPDLQRRHVNPRGGFYFTDFEWPLFSTIGELDGRGKYLKEEYLGSFTPGEAVYEEKIREDHLRAEGNAFARWGHADVVHPERLRTILLRAGLPLRGRE
jgi:predicted transcriptional regulator of viral defense system